MSSLWLVALGVLRTTSPAQALSTALELEQKGDSGRALSALTKLVHEHPAWEPGRLELGRALLLGGLNPDLAEMNLEAACALSPEDAEAHYLYGLLMLDRQKVPSARTSFEQAVFLRPELTDARLKLGSMLMDAGEWLSAVRELSRVKEQDPHSTSARLLLADAEEKSGDAGAAERELLSLRGEQPRSAAVLRRLMGLYSRTGRQDEAKKLAEESGPSEARKRPLRPSRR